MRLDQIEGWTFIILVLLVWTPDLLWGKRNRHRREGKKEMTNAEKEAINEANRKNHELCVAGFCLPTSYIKLNLPSSERQHIKMNLEVLDVLNVNDKKFSVALSMYFGVHWKEDRLILPGDGHNNSGAEWVPIDLDFMQYLWVPNVFVYDIAEFHAIECLKRLAGIWVVKDKELFYNQATHLTFMCPMRFNRFPLDTHVCKFKIGSVNYDDTRMKFSNDKLEYDPTAGNTILDYQVSIQALKKEDQILSYGESGNYSIAGFEMTLVRNSAKYLYIYYLPSGLFVVVSWVSFLIPPEVVPGRMALLVTLFLVLINIFNTITNVSPNVEGMTAISAWMIACMFFVFGALLAYASILYFLLLKKKASQEKKRKSLTVIHSKDCFLFPGSELNKRKEEIGALDQGVRLARVDSIFSIFFPVMFLLFNMAYWPYWMM